MHKKYCFEKRIVLKIALVYFIFLFFIIPLKSQADIYMFVSPDGVKHFADRPEGPGWKLRYIDPSSNQRTWKKSSGGETDRYDNLIVEVANNHRVDPALVRAVIKIESNFNPTAVSSKGARGLMQLIPSTASDLGVRNSFNPRENIKGGTKYLRYLLDEFRGKPTLALAAYNCGRERVLQYGGIPPIKETRDYVPKVMEQWRYYKRHWTPPKNEILAEN